MGVAGYNNPKYGRICSPPICNWCFFRPILCWRFFLVFFAGIACMDVLVEGRDFWSVLDLLLGKFHQV